jgi:hypothetical protein
MAKDVYNFSALAYKNIEKGGAWVAVFKLERVGGEVITDYSAWTSANACKRWLKERVQEHTPRKSIKFVSAKTDANDKVIEVTGEFSYRG